MVDTSFVKQFAILQPKDPRTMTTTRLDSRLEPVPYQMRDLE